jgi:hypothetical protein
MNLTTPTKANKPKDVDIALVLLFTSVIIGRIPKIIQLFQAPSSQAMAYLPDFFLPIVLAYFFYYMVLTGQNWARIITIIFVVLNIPAFISGLSNPDIYLIAKLAAAVEVIFGVIAVVLLFKKSSNEWFSNKN